MIVERASNLSTRGTMSGRLVVKWSCEVSPRHPVTGVEMGSTSNVAAGVVTRRARLVIVLALELGPRGALREWQVIERAFDLGMRGTMSRWLVVKRT